MNNVNPLNAIKLHLKCHMLNSLDALYLLTLLTTCNTAIVEANRVDPEYRPIAVYSVSSLCDPEAFKTFHQTIK